jgi:stress-induced morphogen
MGLKYLGGCGSMYAIDIASASFEGKSIVKQHRLINDLLKEEIKGMHGLQVHYGRQPGIIL